DFVSDTGMPPGELVNGISVLAGDGTGKFTFAGDADSLLPNCAITALTLADVNGDGRLDVVGASGAGVVVALNYVHGNVGYDSFVCRTCSDPTALAAGGTSLQVAVGDVSGDGKPDIVAAGYGTVCVFQNSGGGAFGAGQVYASGGSAIS